MLNVRTMSLKGGMWVTENQFSPYKFQQNEGINTQSDSHSSLDNTLICRPFKFSQEIMVRLTKKCISNSSNLFPIPNSNSDWIILQIAKLEFELDSCCSSTICNILTKQKGSTAFPIHDE